MTKPNTEIPTKKEIKKETVRTPKINKTDLEKAPIKNKIKEKKISQETKKEKKAVKKVKKTEVIVNAKNIPISTKYAAAICKFIKYKTIDKAISDLEHVIKKQKAIPMKGEIPHRKGKIMSGRFPKKASTKFIEILKNLKANAINHDVEEPIIKEAIANIAERPLGRFGAIKRKRTHIKILAKEKKLMKKTKKK